MTTVNSALPLIAVSGDLGSGKSTLARVVAEELRLPYVSTGSLHRSIAAERQLTTLELNRAAERDTSIDQMVDDSLREIAKTNEPVVIDSRLAWWIVPNVRSIHLLVDPAEGAVRAHGRNEKTEVYSSPAEARVATRRRTESERSRFGSLYGVDILKLRNYDMVIDTTSASPEEIAETVLQKLSAPQSAATEAATRPNVLLVDPRRIYPTEMITALRDLDDSSMAKIGSPEYLIDNPIDVIYSRPFFAAVDGHKRLSSAIMRGATWIPCRLVGEGTDALLSDRTVDEYFQAVLSSSSMIHDWNDAHNLSLDVGLDI
jgi:predicted cytidylate kinase